MKIVRTFAILAAAALAWACSPKNEASPSGGDAGVIRFATDWRAQAEHGGFYQALAAGLEWTASLRRACAAGALATTVSGASPSLPRSAQIDALVATREES